MENTIGLIFCSGYGKRLLPYTEKIPKPILLKQNGKTFLEINIERLLDLGIKKIFVSYSYGYDFFEEIAHKFPNNVELIYEEQPVGQGKTICNLIPQIKEYKYLFTSNGDTIMEYDSKNFLNYMMDNNVDFLISSCKDSLVEKSLLVDDTWQLYGWKTTNKEYIYTDRPSNIIYANSLGDNIFTISSLLDVHERASQQDFLGLFGENDLAEIMIKQKKSVKLKIVDIHSYYSINTIEEFNKFNKIHNA